MSGLYDDDWIRPDGQGGIYIGDAHVSRTGLQSVVELMYRVAGTTTPIILPRFNIRADGEAAPLWMVKRDSAGVRVRVSAVLPTDESRTLAAVIAAYADQHDEKEETAR